MLKTTTIWIVFFVAISVLWEGVLRIGWVSPAILAHPWEVALAIPKLLMSSEHLSDTLSTLRFSLIAFLLSVPCGCLAGTLIYFSRGAQAPAEFTVDFLRSIPATAMVPIFFLFFGIDDQTKIFIGMFSSALVIAVATINGLRGRNKTRMSVAGILGLRGWRRIMYVDIPESAQQLFLGMRTGISLALILVVVTEMLIGGNKGLGRVISDTRYSDDKGLMYAALVATGIIGYIFNMSIRITEKKFMHWVGRQ